MSISLLLLGLWAQSTETNVQLKISQISLFRSEVQLLKPSPIRVEVGAKILANTYARHKCLLTVTKVMGNTLVTDATECPGFGTMKKGEFATLAPHGEINEEVRKNILGEN